MSEQKVIYLAGGLFNAGERLHNLYLEKHLLALGWKVVLPQRRALAFFDGEKFDIPAIARDCRDQARDPGTIVVANGDGPDADSGTCVEYALAIDRTGRAIVYRTDFRTALDREVGVNAMLTLPGTRFIYEPCFFTKFCEIDPYFENLARRIHDAALEIIAAQADPL